MARRRWASYNYYGTVFKVSKPAYKWVETVLYSFTGGSDGFYPEGGVTISNGIGVRDHIPRG